MKDFDLMKLSAKPKTSIIQNLRAVSQNGGSVDEGGNSIFANSPLVYGTGQGSLSNKEGRSTMTTGSASSYSHSALPKREVTFASVMQQRNQH